ncbi:MAG: ABC transporter permease subunit [Sulfolobales archaeon]|nr:ABC transporter permease subunit [Sulfolobales archaeon]
MLRYFLLNRLLRMLVVFFIIVLLNFILPRAMPGDPASILANEYNLPAETVRMLRTMWKLDRLLWEQFVAYIESLFTSRWGYSYKYYPRTVFELVMERRDAGTPSATSNNNPSLNNIVLVLAFFGWSSFARVVRAQVLSIRERPYVEAARAVGAGSFRIIAKHILPRVVPLIIANVVISATSAILTEAGLSFLGLGDPTVKSWGQILRRAQVGHAFYQGLWLWVFVPGMGIALLGAGFTLLGIAIEERINPKLRFRGRRA